MAVRKIVYIGDDVLRQKARHVSAFDDDLHTLIDDMVDTLQDAPGVGLAAPQVGVSSRVIVVRLTDDPEEYGEQAGVLYEVVNPEIIRASREEVEGIEACLSIPGWFGTVDRSKWVIVSGQDRHGKIFRIKVHDWLARVFQHEIDHLDGRLFIDIATEKWEHGDEPEWLREQQPVEMAGETDDEPSA